MGREVNQPAAPRKSSIYSASIVHTLIMAKLLGVKNKHQTTIHFLHLHHFIVFICHLRNVFTRLSLVKRVKGSGRGATVYKVVSVGSLCCVSSSCGTGSSTSVNHSPVEVEVPHVFGRFLRGTHLLIVEDDPPAWHRDIYAVTHWHTHIHRRSLDGFYVVFY